MLRAPQTRILVAVEAVDFRNGIDGLARDRELGRKYGVEYAQAFHYIGPEESSRTEDYIRQHAVPLR